MAVKTISKVYNALEGEFLEKVLIIDAATAADTVDITDYIFGKSIADIQVFNMTDITPVTASVNSSTDVVTIGTGPGGDKIAINVRLI